ncbi:MAG: MFS transporter [Firmicutes bacterium]|nr:MFS transporter [Bacillota bacterium]
MTARSPGPRLRDLLLLLPAQFLVYSNLFLALTIMPLYTAHVGGDAFTAGLHTAIFTGCGVALRFYFGPLADRKGRKLPLLIGSLAFATAPLLFLFTTTPASLALARAYQSLGLAAYLAASTSLVADLAPPQWRGTALTVNRIVITLAFTAAPPLGEAVVRTAGFPPFFYGCAVAGLLGVALVALVREPRPAPAGAGDPGGAAADPGAGTTNPYALLLRDRRVVAALGAAAAAALAEGGATGFLPLYMETTGAGGSGPFFLGLGIGGLLAAGAGVLADRRGPMAVIVPATVLAGLGAGALVMDPRVPVLLGGGLCLGIGYTAGLAAAGALLVDAAPARYRTTALALSETAIDGSITLGSPLLGLLAAWQGYPWAFGALALACWMVAGGLALLARGSRPTEKR